MRYTNTQLLEIQSKTTADPKDNAAVVLPLVLDLLEARQDVTRLHEALEKLTTFITVRLMPLDGHPGPLTLEINGTPAYRPIEEPSRDALGMLGRLLLNANTALAVTGGNPASQESQ